MADVILSCAVMAPATSKADFPTVVANVAPEDDIRAVQLTGGAAGFTTHFPPLSNVQPASTVHWAKGTIAQGMVKTAITSGRVRNFITVLVLLPDRHSADAGNAGEHERAGESSPD